MKLSYITWVFVIYTDHLEDTMDWAYNLDKEKRNACRILVGKHRGNQPFRRPDRRLKDNIKVVFRGWRIGYTGSFPTLDFGVGGEGVGVIGASELVVC
jgi:hypothetical protein